MKERRKREMKERMLEKGSEREDTGIGKRRREQSRGMENIK